MSQPPLRDPLADSPPPPSSSRPLRSSDAGPSSAPAPSLSLGLPRGRGGRAAGSIRRGDAASADDAVRATDSDALVSRISALRLGYLPADPYSEDLVSGDRQQHAPSPFMGQARPAPFPVDSSGLRGPPSRTHPMAVESATPRSQPAGPRLDDSLSTSVSASAFGYDDMPTTRMPSNPMLFAVGAGGGAKRPPLINIGTYLRCRSIDQLVEAFLLHDHGSTADGKGKGKQIVSLGAGSDSRYWRIMTSRKLKENLNYYLELDFPQVTVKKVASIRRSPRLQSLIEHSVDQEGNSGSGGGLPGLDSDQPADSFESRRYSIRPFDLRAFGAEGGAGDQLLSGLDASLPTLLLFECVLAYIEPGSTDLMLSYFGRRFDRLAAVGYDMCLAGDADASEGAPQVSRFGTVLLQNLEARNLSLPGAKAALTLQSQADRYPRLWRATGSSATKAGGKSLYQVWEELDSREKERISRLEGLDEVEELDILLKHYCITWASRGVEL